MTVYEEETIILTGDNGVGKSTLLKYIFQAKERKEFQWNVAKDKERISYLGHELGLYSSLSLKENLSYFRSIFKNPISSGEEKNIIEELGLSRRYHDPIYTYSEGMKRKAGIIRALLANPALLLLDEPFNGLDMNSSNVFVDHLNSIKKAMSIIIVSHDIEKIRSFSERHIQIKNGSVVEFND